MNADKLLLYRWAVQDPDTQAAVLEVMYRRLRDGRRPAVLREDFAGTSAEAVAWVNSGEERRAVAVDLDGPTLEWAERRAKRMLGERAGRITFVNGDVMSEQASAAGRADIIAALNFSVFYLHDRAALRGYFEQARRSLAEGGLLVFNAFGGPGAMRIGVVDQRRVQPAPRHVGDDAPPPFDYFWEQCRYDAVANRLDCRIHFSVPGDPGTGSTAMRDAFVYDWRLWTLPELTELVREAGFGEVQVWRHTYDASKGRQGVFLGPVDAVENLDTWLAYIVAAL